MNKLFKSLWIMMIAALVVTGCADYRKAQLQSGSDPDQAIAEISQIMVDAQEDQLDVLADNQYTKGTEFLSNAKQAMKQGQASEDVMEKASIAKAFFQDAKKTGNVRKSSARRILMARKSALSAGVRKSDALVESMMKIDDDLKSETSQFSKPLSPEDFSEFQKKYLVLEARAVQFTQLNSADTAINQAIKNDAEDLAPKSLRDASLDYKTALNMIEQSPRSPDVYKNSVDEALASTTLLFDVMNVILGAKGTPENIAVQIVKQKRALGELSSNVGKLEANLKTTKQSLEEKEGVLKTQEKQLESASTQVKFQQAMDEAQQVLSQDDALVYQQGKKLIFRLKRVNFKSGAAVIPRDSEQLISKVDAIIKKLDADKVVVQGHTDSVGSATVNKKLSKERAAAVAKYLSSLRGGYKITYSGYGESHPIASNETAGGRATNRRVDLVLSVKQ
ncbi:MAG: OmpA family protein [Gammaproteobacteria bacterium]|nr:OmpA family protein [Gammaproteobacteria bacterium]MCW8986600.1 OmpA family protein [Gammaproteobacteria bacterium]MCW9029960.1 OmpA family protein [Gammaproteobacteria bacterium]